MIFRYYIIILILGNQQFSALLPEIYIFFRYFFVMFICNCFSIIIFWIFEVFVVFFSNFITNQIVGCFSWFWKYSFWISFKGICCRLFLALFTTHGFNHIFENIFTLHLITKFMFILSSISNGLEFWWILF